MSPDKPRQPDPEAQAPRPDTGTGHDYPHFETILNSIAEGVFTINRDWCIDTFNAAAERLTGYSAEEAIGRHCWDVFRSDMCQDDCALRRSLESGEPVSNIEVRIHNKYGLEHPVSVSTAILQDEAGEVIGAVETLRDLSEIRQLTQELQGRYHLGRLIGKSHVMQEIYDLIEMVAESDANVLIRGESGTGKELIARAIHYASPRRDRPFIGLHCAALPEELLESELFGHSKGAFTGAHRDKPGRFEMADTGTLLLDEVSEISLSMQVKLLRVLQERAFERVGGTQTLEVDIRLIAATNRDLKVAMQQGEFRKDLYYRLKVVEIHVPPLRDRREDIPLLVEHFVRHFNERTRKSIERLSSRALTQLMDYSWPGNVRELENVIEHAFVRCPGGVVLPEHLPNDIRAEQPVFSSVIGETDPLEAAEKLVLQEMIAVTGGIRKQMAQRLGISLPTLWRKLKKHHLLDNGVAEVSEEPSAHV